MAKNKPYMSQNLAYLLSEFYNASKKSICFITKNDSESKLLLNELKYFLKPEEVLWFPESEILPYDHFSIPNKITKKRFAILNKENDSKNIIITSVKNLFERFPSIEYFKSSGSFDTNTKISIDELKRDENKDPNEEAALLAFRKKRMGLGGQRIPPPPFFSPLSTIS